MGSCAADGMAFPCLLHLLKAVFEAVPSRSLLASEEMSPIGRGEARRGGGAMGLALVGVQHAGVGVNRLVETARRAGIVEVADEGGLGHLLALVEAIRLVDQRVELGTLLAFVDYKVLGPLLFGD